MLSPGVGHVSSGTVRVPWLDHDADVQGTEAARAGRCAEMLGAVAATAVPLTNWRSSTEAGSGCGSCTPGVTAAPGQAVSCTERVRYHRRQHQHLQGSARPVATRACSGRLHGDAGYDGCTPGQRPGQRAQLFRRLRQPPGTQVERRDAFVSGRVERASTITAQPCHGFRGSCKTNGLASARHACMNALF